MYVCICESLCVRVCVCVCVFVCLPFFLRHLWGLRFAWMLTFTDRYSIYYFYFISICCYGMHSGAITIC